MEIQYHYKQSIVNKKKSTSFAILQKEIRISLLIFQTAHSSLPLALYISIWQTLKEARD